MYAWRADERRQFRRVHLNLPVLYSVEGPADFLGMLGGREFAASSVDFCEGGVAILTNRYVPVSLQINIKFFLPSNAGEDVNIKSRIIKLSGITNYIIPTHIRSQYRLGISFKDLDDSFEAAYFELMCAPDNHRISQNL